MEKEGDKDKKKKISKEEMVHSYELIKAEKYSGPLSELRGPCSFLDRVAPLHGDISWRERLIRKAIKKNSLLKDLKKSVILYQYDVFDELITLGLYAKAQKLTAFFIPSKYEIQLIHYSLNYILEEMSKSGKNGQFDTPKESPLYKVAHFFTSKIQHYLPAIKDEKQWALLQENNTVVLNTLMNQFFLDYKDQQMNDLLAYVYEAYVNLLVNNKPYHEEELVRGWEDELETREPRLRQHNPFNEVRYIRDILDPGLAILLPTLLRNARQDANQEDKPLVSALCNTFNPFIAAQGTTIVEK